MKGIALLSLATLLAACSGDAVNDAQEDYRARHEATVFDGQTRSLDRAREVQIDLDERAAKTRRALERAESGVPD